MKRGGRPFKNGCQTGKHLGLGMRWQYKKNAFWRGKYAISKKHYVSKCGVSSPCHLTPFHPLDNDRNNWIKISLLATVALIRTLRIHEHRSSGLFFFFHRRMTPLLKLGSSERDEWSATHTLCPWPIQKTHYKWIRRHILPTPLLLSHDKLSWSYPSHTTNLIQIIPFL